MANDDEATPSAPRRQQEVELGRGVVILPPERMREDRRAEQRPEEAAKRAEQRREEALRPISPLPVTPGKQGVLVLVVGVLAVVAIILSLFAMSSVAHIKGEIKLMAADLRAFSQSELELNTHLDSTHTISSSVPLKETISPFSLPVPPQEIEGSGAINVVLPGYNYPVSIPWNGTLTVFGTVTVNTTELSDDRRLSLSYTLPGTGEMVMKVAASDMFKGYLNDLTVRLEQLSR